MLLQWIEMFFAACVFILVIFLLLYNMITKNFDRWMKIRAS